MQRFFVSRLLERLCRRWYLYLIPPMLIIAGGLAMILQQEAPYRSSGVIRVSGQTLLSEITSVRGDSSFGFDTPAIYTSREINTLLGTELFTESVIEAAGLTEAVATGALAVLRTERRESGRRRAGDLLVRVNVTGQNPEVSYRLATATIESYLQWQIDDNVTDSRSAEEFFEGLLAPYEERLQEARDEPVAGLPRRESGVGGERSPRRRTGRDHQPVRRGRTGRRPAGNRHTVTRRCATGNGADIDRRHPAPADRRRPETPRRSRTASPEGCDDPLPLRGPRALVSLAALIVSTLTDHSGRSTARRSRRSSACPWSRTVPDLLRAPPEPHSMRARSTP